MGNTLQKLPPQQEEEVELQPEDQTSEFTCEICIEPSPISDRKFINSDKCSHPFCTDCVVKYIRVQLDDNNVGHINCPAPGCRHALDPVACAALVGAALHARWCDVLCESEISGLEKRYCPYRDCNELVVNECGGSVGKATCPNCKGLFCFECGRVWHAGFGCGERMDGNDAVFGSMVEDREWTRCPGCRHFVELVEGCWIVKCRCGTDFCYKCGKQVLQHRCNVCDKHVQIAPNPMCCQRGQCFCYLLIIFIPFVLFLLGKALYIAFTKAISRF